MFIIVMIASMAAVGFAGSGGSSGPGAESEDIEPPEETPVNANHFPDGPKAVVDASQPHVAVLETNKGTIKMDLLSDAPEAVNSFAFLAGSGFYNGTVFFYVNHDYFAQGGDPNCAVDSEVRCTGTAGPGYTLSVENPEATHEQWAVVAPYVTQGQAVHGSQFRILYHDDPRLDGTETIFGKITDPASQEILSSLGDLEPCNVVSSADCDSVDDASSGLVIEKVTVQPAPA